MSGSIGDPQNRNTFAGYSKHFWTAKIPKDRWNEVVWSNRWYNPEDNRSTAPVQRHKFLAQPQPHTIPTYWITLPDIPMKYFSRSKEEKDIHVSAPSSRCEQWSTLRQMLPSKGHSCHTLPLKWGTSHSRPPTWSAKRPRRFPHINSEMTNYVDDMHQTNRLFRLY